MPKISVIITLYNLYELITECLESVKNQTYKDYEVIIVDDGSVDGSDNLVIEYISSNQLHNFSLIQKANGGISSARNLGIEKAAGEWIAFIDGDDWVEPSYLQDMIEDMDTHPVDLSIVGYRQYDMITRQFSPRVNYTSEYGTLPENLGDLYSFGRIWARIYKRSIILEHNIRFDERITYCEDDAFNFDYNTYVKSFRMRNIMSYNYRVNRHGALTNRLIRPEIKRHLDPHMQGFCESMSFSDLITGMKNNRNLSFVMWNVFHSTFVNYVLDGNSKEAALYRKTNLSREIIRCYAPRTGKEKIFRSLIRFSFSATKFFVKVYYGNFDKIRNSKLLKKLSND